MRCFKKKGFWVFYAVMVLAGALVIVAIGIQNQPPVIPDVNAQMMLDGVSSSGFSSPSFLGYAGSFSSGYNIMGGNLGSYRSLFGLLDVQGSQGPSRTMFNCDGGTMDTCYIDCGWTQRTCFDCRYTDELCHIGPVGRPLDIDEILYKPTSHTCAGHYTCLTCSGYSCTGGGGVPIASMLTCSSYSCGVGGGVPSTLFCNRHLTVEIANSLKNR